MENIEIRSEREADSERIREVHEVAFGARGEGELVHLIRTHDAFVPDLSIVAELGGKVVGHVLFSKVRLVENGNDLNCLSLAPVAVLPELQRKSIGAQLINAGIERAKRLGFRSILVLGDPGYYPRFGFKHALTTNIESKYSCNAYMGLELVDDSLSGIAKASVRYPEAFSVVD